MFYILWKRRELARWQTFLLVLIFLPLEIIERLAGGALYQLLYFILFVGIVSMYYNKKFPLVSSVILLIFFIAFNPVKDVFRYLTWEEENKSVITVAKNTALLISLTTEYISNLTDTSEFIVSQEGSLARIGHTFVFSTVVNDTPEHVPYWKGETYKPILTMFIPRILWPDKPEERVGQSFGHRYGFLGPADDVTSINLPFIVELYANFGAIGVVMGMAILGCLIAFLEAKLNRPDMTPLEFVVGMTIILPLIFQESNLSLMTGSILLLSISIYLYFHCGLRTHLNLNSNN